MDPTETFNHWLDADPSERAAIARDYNEWISKGGFPAEAHAFVNQVMGVRVQVTVRKLGPVRITAECYYAGQTWTQFLRAGNILGTFVR